MKSYLVNFVKGIGAGLAISIGSFAYVVACSMDQKFLGSFVFAIGLLIVCFLSFNLYTGKIGFALEGNRKTPLNLIVTFLGNIVGSVATGYLLFLAFNGSNPFIETIEGIVYSRTGETWYKALITSFFCGMLVFLSVYGFKKFTSEIAKIVCIIACVGVFVLCGFEHCIANTFYFSFANMWNWKSVLNILLTTLGNSIGALLLYLLAVKVKEPQQITK